MYCIRSLKVESAKEKQLFDVVIPCPGELVCISGLKAKARCSFNILVRFDLLQIARGEKMHLLRYWNDDWF